MTRTDSSTVQATQPRRRKRWKFVAVILAGSLALAFVVGEVAARVLFPAYANNAKYDKMLYGRIVNSPFILERDATTHPKFGGVLSPNATNTTRSPEFTFTARTNSLGFRTKEIVPKEPDEWRVMMVGDSFFYGHGVEEPNMISSQLERIASQGPKAGKSLSVYNLSRMGYTTVQELIVARTYIPQVKPDHLLVGLFIANDMVPNAASRIDDDGNFAPDPETIAKIKADVGSRIGLLRHSVIWRIASMSPYTTRLYYEIARQPYVLEKNYRLLDAFRDDCERQQIALTVVIMYAKDGVRGGLHNRWTRSREAARPLVEYCRTHRIPVIDMLDVMEGPTDCRKYLYPSDGHFNPEGCRTMAQAIFDAAVSGHLHEGLDDDR